MYKIKKFVVGPLQSNSYVLWNEKNEALIFDIGSFEFEEIIDFINKNNLNLKALFLTHGHIDHIAGVNLIMNIFPNLEVYIGKNEKEYLVNSEYNLSYSIFRQVFTVSNLSRIKFINDNDIVLGVKVIGTPGHTKGGVCYFLSKKNI